MPAVTNLTYAVLDQTLDDIERRGGSITVAQALREPKRLWSYARLHAEVCRTAAALCGQGLSRGDRVAIFMHDGGEMAATLLGAIRAGLCAVPLSDTLRPREVLEVLVDCGASAVVAHADLAEGISGLSSASSGPMASSSFSPVLNGPPSELKAIFCLGGSLPGTQDFAALCFDADPHFDPVTPAQGDPAFLLYDTGPDGRLRGYGYPHGMLLSAYERYALPVLKLTQEDRVFSTARLCRPFGLSHNLFFPLRAGAVSFLLPDQVRSRPVFDVLGSFRPTIFCATPSLYNELVQDFLEMSAPRPAYFHSVRLPISYAEPLPLAVERRLRGMFQFQLAHCFCPGEAFQAVLWNAPERFRSGSHGQPLPKVEVRLCDDHGTAVLGAEIGHLELRAEHFAGGPWSGVERRVRTPDPAPKGGWLRTEERFFRDEDGYYFQVGRGDGLFRIADALVSPGQIEQTLLGHPSVWECAVVEDHDDEGLPLPKAYVVLNLGSEPSVKLARELMEFVKRQISPHKYPRAVEFLSQLPRDPDGKVARWRLRPRPVPQIFSPPSGLSPVRGATPARLLRYGSAEQSGTPVFGSAQQSGAPGIEKKSGPEDK